MNSNRKHILVLLSLPVLIGIMAGIASGSGLMVSIVKSVVGVMVALLFLRTLARVLRLAVIGPSAPDLIHPQRDTPLGSGYVEEVDRNTKILHADGYAFEMTNRFGGRLQWREVDPSSKTPISTWIQAHDGDLRGQAQVMKDYIVTKVNKRKGL